MPQRADRHEIRIRITGTNNPDQDVEDLKAWLEREPWLNRRSHDWELRPAQERDDGPGDMAIGVDDLILVVVGAVAAEITKSLGIALREWLRRRREERDTGERPAVAVGGGDGELRALGEPGPGAAAPERPDPGSPANEGGSTAGD
ncbi:hypothetical protein NCG97_28925 [Streptomyces lydicamycinicus]|uniref:Uncharacterized protein n=1 Tax=Streptomyces lydicamycinicus TaxID=1546107 RepID=A0A0N7YMT5_9ACTN|nr:hypothetical protein [Streptomyces lydicamycinicus]USA03731.1 hypothetical protein NCG97_28925 [Streptomyces lydicamycinicus]GAO12507.1 hypothetical protein TPA0598_11_00680 [Streptomyces lydicamycinicus]